MLQTIRRLCAFGILFLCATAVHAEGICIGCTNNVGSTAAGDSAFVADGAPQRGAAVVADRRFCQTSAPYCLVANAQLRKLSLFHNGQGVISWDIIMLPPGRVMRGRIAEVILNPSWCPTASLRRRYDLPAGCIPPGHPQNAMGDVKITLSGDFAGTAIRIHDTPGFGSQWPNEDSSGCVRVLNLRAELLPRIQQGRVPVEVVFH